MLRKKSQQKQQQYFLLHTSEENKKYVCSFLFFIFALTLKNIYHQMLHKNLKLIKRNMKELEEKNERITKDFNSR